MTPEEFIAKSNQMHGGNLVIVTDFGGRVNWKGRIDVFCKKHNRTFNQSVNNHHAGYNPCKQCGAEERSSRPLAPKFLDKFKEQATEVHGGRFDYSNTIYKGRHVKLEIKCLTCSHVFNMTAGNHLLGQGCPECRKIKLSECAKNNFHLNDTNKEDPCILYYVVLKRGDILFEKIGITRLTIEKRFYSQAEIISSSVIMESTYEKCVEAEQRIHTSLQKHRMRMRKLKGSFYGWTECYPIGTVTASEVLFLTEQSIFR